MRYSILATEGPHDQAFLAKLLKVIGFKAIEDDYNSLDPFWKGFVPKYPPASGRLYTRMNMPSILASQTDSVAIYWGEGSNLVDNVIALAANNSDYKDAIHAFGLVVDADDKQPNIVAKEKAQKLQIIFPTMSEIPGEITPGTPRTGIYLLPDNQGQGTLDSCLVKCASVVYPDHRTGAEKFLNELDSRHTSHLRTSIAREKAVVACIVGVLKPGKSNTASLADNNWVSKQTVSNVDEISSLCGFVKSLLEIS